MAHLVEQHQVSQRRAYDVLQTDRSSVRYLISAVVDDFSRENLVLVAETSLSGHLVVRELDSIIAKRGALKTIVSDNGTKFTRVAILKWVQNAGIDWHYIAPGKPRRNGFTGSFNGKLRPSHACQHSLPGNG